MKKKIYILSMAIILSVALCGCGKKDKDKKDTVSVKDDVVEFVNDELAPIETDRNNAIAIYNSYFTTEDADLELFVTNMKDNAIPSMETYISNLTGIEVATDEVTGLKNIYLQSAQKQLDAMKKVVLAIEEQNPEYLTEAETLITEAETGISQYEAQLKLLAEENDIVIQNSVSE